MKRKALTILLTGVLCVGLLTACGTSPDSTKSEETTVATESSEIETNTSTEELETEETKETESTEVETETSDTEETASTEKESTAAQAENKPTETKPEQPKQTEPTPAPHTHSYSSSITQNASCNANGVKTFTCSCGDSYTETIPMTDHNWVAQTETIHHEATGHYEDRVTGYDEKKVIICGCGKRFYDNDSFKYHDENECGSNCTVTTERTPITESVWIEDSQAWDETITTGHTCSSCGATK